MGEDTGKDIFFDCGDIFHMRYKVRWLIGESSREKRSKRWEVQNALRCERAHLRVGERAWINEVHAVEEV